ncbi:thiol reductase thioredoxin [Burkholderia sp. WAC0059]|uniref:thioredoxin family protein n=1 Tax=Burkholderia sp. WAC0059 TaxID=2066022 RepID=UPI000C7F0848|nr:thioredoxin family protein [Burkholderia sp. WAC0059]PLZ00922.1 thiol reductase thioredoxin [Burkholderia sp. WAC0059]
MTRADAYAATAPDRRTVDAFAGSTVLEFGTDWCGYCRGAQPLVAEAFGRHPDVRHLKIEDGPGRALGRSYRVKLWPTLVFLRDGAEVARVVRPTQAAELDDAFAALGKPAGLP